MQQIKALYIIQKNGTLEIKISMYLGGAVHGLSKLCFYGSFNSKLRGIF